MTKIDSASNISINVDAGISVGVAHAELSGIFKALADPARVAILDALGRAERAICVCDFTGALGLNQSTVSHHLRILKDANLVSSERRGTWGYYSLAPGARKRLENAVASVLPVKELV